MDEENKNEAKQESPEATSPEPTSEPTASEPTSEVGDTTGSESVPDTGEVTDTMAKSKEAV